MRLRQNVGRSSAFCAFSQCRTALVALSALVVVFATVETASAELIIRRELIGLVPTAALPGGGYRWEFGNNLHNRCSDLTACNDDVRLAVGDTLQLTID